MTADVGFFFAVTGASMSLASIAGLVVGFRRTGTWAAHDLYRLRQIVEWGFANAILALAAFPLAGIAGEGPALRSLGVIALAYLVANVVLLLRRRGTLRSILPVRPLAVMTDGVAMILCAATAILGTINAWELTLLVLVVRPMIVFIWVLMSIHSDGESA